MITKERLLDVAVILIGVIYLIGLWWVPELIGNRYNY
jgi:hypothetical protein